MDIEYNRPGTMRISLNEADVHSIRSQGFCMDRNGFAGMASKTWVYYDRVYRYGRALIDNGGDLSVYVPSEAQWRYEVPRERTELMSDRAALIDYLGETGSIIVEWQT